MSHIRCQLELCLLWLLPCKLLEAQELRKLHLPIDPPHASAAHILEPLQLHHEHTGECREPFPPLPHLVAPTLAPHLDLLRHILTEVAPQRQPTPRRRDAQRQADIRVLLGMDAATAGAGPAGLENKLEGRPERGCLPVLLPHRAAQPQEELLDVGVLVHAAVGPGRGAGGAAEHLVEARDGGVEAGGRALVALHDAVEGACEAFGALAAVRALSRGGPQCGAEGRSVGERLEEPEPVAKGGVAPFDSMGFGQGAIFSRGDLLGGFRIFEADRTFEEVLEAYADIGYRNAFDDGAICFDKFEAIAMLLCLLGFGGLLRWFGNSLRRFWIGLGRPHGSLGRRRGSGFSA